MTRRKQVLIAGGVVAVAGAIAFANGLRGPFVFDDPSSITANTTIRHLSHLGTVLRGPTATVSAQGRPILNLSLAINYALGGKAVVGYHIANVLIHLGAALALFGILRRIWRGEVAIPAAIAAVWAVHPLQTESVTYVIQRAESLMGLFYFLTVYCFVRYASDVEAAPPPLSPLQAARAPLPPRRWAWMAVVFCFLGMATKEDMVSAPLIVLLFDRTWVAGSFAAALRLRWRFYLALASSWLLLAYLIWTTGGNRGGSVGFGVNVVTYEYWLTQFRAIPLYLRLSFWPHPLIFEYGTFWIYHLSEVWLGALFVGALAGATVWGLWKRPAPGFAGVFFFAVLAPTSVMPGTTQMIVEHRMYLPLAAVLALAIAGLAVLNRRTAIILAGAFALVCLVMTWSRNLEYRSASGLWELTVLERPNNVLGHTMLALALENDGRTDEALIHFQRAADLNPRFPMAQEGLGENLAKRGQLTEAIGHYRSAISQKPDYADAHDNLGVALGRQRKYDEAIAEIRQALVINPDYSTAHYNLAGVLSDSGQKSAAIAEYRKALADNPDYAEAEYNLGNVFGDLGQYTQAIEAYQAAIRVKPDYARAEYNLANTYAALHRPADAVVHYRAVIRIHPGDLDAENNLGSALWESGHPAEAAEHFQTVLRLDPSDSAARENLRRLQAILAAPTAP